MKDLETDNEPFDLIKDTLDKYEEQYILGSWESFVRKKNRRRIILYWFTGTGIAAAILLGWIGFRVFQFSPGSANSETPEQFAGSIPSPAGRVSKKEELLDSGINSGQVDLDSVIKQSYASYYNGGDSGNTQKETTICSILNIYRNEPDGEVHRIVIDMSNSLSVSGLTAGLLDQKIIQNTEILLADRGSSILSPDVKVEISRYPESVSSEIITDEIRSYKFRLGVNVSSGVSRANTSASAYFGGGINADYNFFSKFSISTGIQVERHNVMNEASDSPGWLPPGQIQASLLDIDIPVNIKWQFLAHRSTSYYVSGGVSSVLYLSEKYTNTSYSQRIVPNLEMDNGTPYVSYQIENVKTTEEIKEPPLSTFDFAGRINIILGFEYKLKTRLSIQIEPYLKLPVSEPATQNIRFTTSGLSCRISF